MILRNVIGFDNLVLRQAALILRLVVGKLLFSLLFGDLFKGVSIE